MYIEGYKPWIILLKYVQIKTKTSINKKFWNLEKSDIPSDGGFDVKWIEIKVDDSEQAIRIMRPSGSHVAPYHQ